MHFGGLVRTAKGAVRGDKDREGEATARTVLGGAVGMDMSFDMLESQNGLS